jgi:hypothetical protein
LEEESSGHCQSLPPRTFNCEDFLIKCVKCYVTSPRNGESLYPQNIQLCPMKGCFLVSQLSLPLLEAVIALVFVSYFCEIFGVLLFSFPNKEILPLGLPSIKVTKELHTALCVER